MDNPPNSVIKTFAQIDGGTERGEASLPLLFRFPSLQRLKALKHGVFARHGGKSRPPYHSLNTSYQVGDRLQHVRSNLGLIRTIMQADQLISVRQVHDRNILVLDHMVPGDGSINHEADALLTTKPGLALMIKLADCQGAVLFDPVQGVLSVIHCGWRGHVKNIYGHVVEKMVQGFHCRPSHIRAAISPSLGPCCAEFKTYRDLFPVSFLDFMERKNYFNLWELGKRQLIQAGLTYENIETADICTRCRRDYFYSYRGEHITGRFALVAMLAK